MKYSDLKTIIQTKNLAWQYEDKDSIWLIYAADGVKIHECELPKSLSGISGISQQDIDQHAADLSDWTTNYKPISNYAGGIRTNPFATPDFDFAGEGLFAVCTLGSAVDIDYTAANDVYINGGVFITENAILGDWIEVNVVHPTYGVVKQWVKKWYVPPTPAGAAVIPTQIQTPYAGNILTGLTLRLTYHSTASSGFNPKIAVNYFLHKPL